MKTLILGTLLLATPAAAQTQAQMNARAGAGWKASDVAMTAQWQRSYAYMKRLDAQGRPGGGGLGYAAALLESQRAWLRFRDAQCGLESARNGGGSIQPMVRAQCAERMTRERTKQLRAAQWR